MPNVILHVSAAFETHPTNRRTGEISMKARLMIVVVALALLTGCTALYAQAPEREIQTGVKTTGEGWAVMTQVTVSIDDFSAAGKTFGDAFDKLWTGALAVALTPLGPGHMVMTNIPAAPPAEGELTLEVQLPIIEQPTDEDLDAVGDLFIVPIEATKVAYTYHKGPVEQLQGSFMRLLGWVMANGHQLAGAPRIIAYAMSDDPSLQTAELQVPIE
jgi:effector-binding domain-containing protein